MKKLFVLLFAIVALSSLSFGQIAGTAHDFSGETWNANNEICVTCHTPHNADTTIAESPLWNHEVSAITTYTTYTSPTFQGVVSNANDINGVSKLCLSCHDGTVAVDSYGGSTGTNLITTWTGRTAVGVVTGGVTGDNNMSSEHPISFVYDQTLRTADGELEDPASAPVDDLLYGSTPDEKTLECTSCHDVHATGTITGTPLLRVTNVNSALCTTCHIK